MLSFVASAKVAMREFPWTPANLWDLLINEKIRGQALKPFHTYTLVSLCYNKKPRAAFRMFTAFRDVKENELETIWKTNVKERNLWFLFWLPAQSESVPESKCNVERVTLLR